jgi:hypothetical protein
VSLAKWDERQCKLDVADREKKRPAADGDSPNPPRYSRVAVGDGTPKSTARPVADDDAGEKLL